jgi:hypothetical protein
MTAVLSVALNFTLSKVSILGIQHQLISTDSAAPLIEQVRFPDSLPINAIFILLLAVAVQRRTARREPDTSAVQSSELDILSNSFPTHPTTLSFSQP